MAEVRAEAVAGRGAPPGVEGVPSTARVRVRRLAERGRYDRATIEAILDEGFVCHVGVVVETGPVVIPTAYARIDDRLYLHGAPANATLGQASSGMAVCVTVTLVDGLVLARSAFHHSINYRSVVVYGTGTEVTDVEEKRAALAAVVEHIVPGRGADALSSDRRRAPCHPGGPCPPGRGVRQDPDRWAEGRSRGPRPAGVGRPGTASDGAVRARRRRGPAGVVPDPPIPDRLRPTAGRDSDGRGVPAG